MVFQYGLTSGLVGGVGRDAAYVINHLKKMKHTLFNSLKSVV